MLSMGLSSAVFDYMASPSDPEYVMLYGDFIELNMPF